MSSITSVRIYAVIIAILCETLRALQVWNSPLTAVLWIFNVHWTVTTPLIFSTLLPTISIAGISSIIAGVCTCIFSVLLLLSTVITLRCNIACISTFVPDILRLGILSFLTLITFFFTIEWWNVEWNETVKHTSLKRVLSLLILLGIVPAIVLLFSTRGVFLLPAVAIDPALLWVTLLDRRQTYTLAFVAVLLLVVLDVLHVCLFNDTEYFFNILVLRTVIDAGRLYMRVKTI
jgi:hypothetical protein